METPREPRLPLTPAAFWGEAAARFGFRDWSEVGDDHEVTEFATLSHQGKVRGNNEDAHLAWRYDRAGTSDPVTALILADGMGGEEGGEIASAIVVETVGVELLRAALDGQLDRETPALLTRLLHTAHERVRETGAARGLADKMASTGIAALLRGSTLHLAHLGDSRGYVFRAGELSQVTEDHTIVNELVRIGRVAPEAAATHHLRHVLTQAIGKGTALEPAVATLTVSPGDLLLLCSDGLYGMVREAKLAAILGRRGPLAATAAALVEAALAGGGEDNVTVVLARVAEPDGGVFVRNALTIGAQGTIVGYRSQEER